MQHLSNLARIYVAKEDEAALAAKVESVLGYVAELTKIDTDMYTHTSAPEHRNILRADVAVPPTADERGQILENAPERHGDLFRVQKMIG